MHCFFHINLAAALHEPPHRRADALRECPFPLLGACDEADLGLLTSRDALLWRTSGRGREITRRVFDRARTRTSAGSKLELDALSDRSAEGVPAASAPKVTLFTRPERAVSLLFPSFPPLTRWRYANGDPCDLRRSNLLLPEAPDPGCPQHAPGEAVSLLSGYAEALEARLAWAVARTSARLTGTPAPRLTDEQLREYLRTVAKTESLLVAPYQEHRDFLRAQFGWVPENNVVRYLLSGLLRRQEGPEFDAIYAKIADYRRDLARTRARLGYPALRGRPLRESVRLPSATFSFNP